MEKEVNALPLVSQPAMPSAPPMPRAGEATPYYRGPPEDPHSVDHMTAADAPPPYEDTLQALHSVPYMTAPSAPSYHQQPVQRTQQAMHGHGTPLLHHPTRYQSKEASFG